MWIFCENVRNSRMNLFARPILNTCSLAQSRFLFSRLFSPLTLFPVMMNANKRNRHDDHQNDDHTTATRTNTGSMSRTFGRIQKKLTIGLLPVMFKLGIMTMVIFTILLLAAKAVFIGKLLLIINLGFIMAKLIAWKSTEQQHHHRHQDWSPAQRYDSGSSGGSANDIHLHIHNAAPVVYPVARQNDLPYGAYAQRGPSITIDTAPQPQQQYQQQTYTSSDLNNSGGANWGGYQRRNANADGFGTGQEAASYRSASAVYPQQSPIYVPNVQY